MSYLDYGNSVNIGNLDVNLEGYFTICFILAKEVGNLYASF